MKPIWPPGQSGIIALIGSQVRLRAGSPAVDDREQVIDIDCSIIVDVFWTGWAVDIMAHHDGIPGSSALDAGEFDRPDTGVADAAGAERLAAVQAWIAAGCSHAIPDRHRIVACLTAICFGRIDAVRAAVVLIDVAAGAEARFGLFTVNFRIIAVQARIEGPVDFLTEAVALRGLETEQAIVTFDAAGTKRRHIAFTWNAIACVDAA